MDLIVDNINNQIPLSSTMRLETSLCHIDSVRVVIKVEGWHNGDSIGSSLGEAKTVDEAENKAIKKLLNRSRLSIKGELEQLKTNITTDEYETKKNDKETKLMPNKQKIISENEKVMSQKNNSTIYSDPKDWSKDLFEIDSELKRIGWDKENEKVYLKKLYGYNNRNRITKYNELKILLMNLRTIAKGTDPKSINLSKNDLISESNSLLKKLNWKEEKGREFLKLKFKTNSRNDLNNSQLLEFNLMLTEENNRTKIENINN